jgi:tetratricopeptide (TPR) repeat protein
MRNQGEFGFIKIILTVTAAAAFVCSAGAQSSGGGSGGGTGAGGGGGGTSTSGAGKEIGHDTSLTNPEVALAVVRPKEKKEQKAYETFRDVPATDVANKIKTGEKFLNDFPKSELTMYVYPYLVVCYIQSNQLDKGLAAAKKDFAVNPKDYRTMAVLSQTLARTYNPSAPDAEEQLAKATDYGKKALEGSPTQAKPEGMTEDAFVAIKKETEAMAHSGVGLVALRKNNYPEAIAEIGKSVGLNDTDQTNYYLLGVANQNSEHMAEAAKAFTKCASLPGNLQATCSSAAVEATKSGAK